MLLTFRSQKIFFSFVVVAFTAMLAVDPSGSLDAAKDAISLAGRAVVPALFPFFVCSELIIALDVANILGKFLTPMMQPIFKINGSGAIALVLGLISGYPTGARAATGLVEIGAISKQEGERLLAFCNNSGPLFILGAVGAGMLNRPDLGLVIYLSHFLSSISIGIIFGIGKTATSKKKSTPINFKEQMAFGELFGNAVKKSAETVFMISGYVIIFNILIKGLSKFGILNFLVNIGNHFNMSKGVAEAFLCGFFEPTNGARAASAIFDSSPILSLVMLSAVIGWAGISVHLQVLSIISKAGLSPKKYFLGKLLHSIVAPIYTLILLLFMPLEKPVFFVLDNFNASGVPNIEQLALSSLYYLMLGISMALIFSGLAWIYLIIYHLTTNNDTAFAVFSRCVCTDKKP